MRTLIGEHSLGRRCLGIRVLNGRGFSHQGEMICGCIVFEGGGTGFKILGNLPSNVIGSTAED